MFPPPKHIVSNIKCCKRNVYKAYHLKVSNALCSGMTENYTSLLKQVSFQETPASHSLKKHYCVTFNLMPYCVLYIVFFSQSHNSKLQGVPNIRIPLCEKRLYPFQSRCLKLWKVLGAPTTLSCIIRSALNVAIVSQQK